MINVDTNYDKDKMFITTEEKRKGKIRKRKGRRELATGLVRTFKSQSNQADRASQTTGNRLLDEQFCLVPALTAGVKNIWKHTTELMQVKVYELY